MAFSPGKAKTNGKGSRRCYSWIEQFVKDTDNLETAEVFRRWAGIVSLGAALEQKCWMTTTSRLYPNIYCILVGAPGVGKTRTISRARKYLETLAGTDLSQGLHVAPTSMTSASLVDALLASKRTLISFKSSAQEFHSMVLLPDEWAAFSSKFDDDLIGNLTTFYDVVVPYSQWRRHKETKIVIEHPQLSILGGSSPSNLLKYIPENAWDQGFCSRMMLVYDGKNRQIGDDFDPERKERPANPDLVKDLAMVFALGGEFQISHEFRDAVNDWRMAGENPRPDHPKLEHYNTRRRAHLYKLAMVASVDRDNNMVILGEDFHRALSWLQEAELNMNNIFDEGQSSVDAKAMVEIVNFVKRKGTVGESQVIWYTCQKVPNYAVYKVIDLLVHSGQLIRDAEKKTFKASE